MSDSRHEGGGVLLVEFVQGSETAGHSWLDYPYMQAFLKENGVPVSWVYLPRSADPEVGADPFQPEKHYAEALVEETRRQQPTVIFLSEACAEPFADALRGAVRGRDPVVYWEGLPRKISQFHALVEWLDMDAEPPANPADVGIVPDYTSRNLCEVLFAEFPFQYFHPAEWCRHAVPLRKNPYFEGIDLEGVVQETGCSFCLRAERRFPAGPRLSREARLARFRRELKSYVETAPLERQSAWLQVSDAALFPGYLEVVVELPLQPSVFLLVRRADEILDGEETLRRVIPELAKRGHRLVFDCVGIENFSPRENLRLNKGLSAEKARRALRMMYDLETRWPDTCYFYRLLPHLVTSEDHPVGFMMILFTPWTEVADLRTNLDALEALAAELPPLRDLRYQLATRLELRPNTAITRLARRDGLVVTDFEDALTAGYSHPRQGDSNELPWRFADPAVARIYQWVVRLIDSRHVNISGEVARAPSEGERLQSRLNDMLSGLEGPKPPPLALVRGVVEVVGGGDPSASDEELIRKLAAHLELPDAPAPAPSA